MKKLRKVGKIAIPAVAIAAAGAGSYMTYDKYGAQDNTLTLANVEALSKKNKLCETCVDFNGAEIDLTQYAIHSVEGYDFLSVGHSDQYGWVAQGNLHGEYGMWKIAGGGGASFDTSKKNTEVVGMPACHISEKNICAKAWLSGRTASGAWMPLPLVLGEKVG